MEDIDKLIGDAIWICRKYEKASPPLLQRTLCIDYYTAEKVFSELEKMEVIVHAIDEFDGEEFVRIGEVNKEKLEEFSKN